MVITTFMQNVFGQSKNDFAISLTLSLSWMESQTRVVLLSQWKLILQGVPTGTNFRPKRSLMA